MPYSDDKLIERIDEMLKRIDELETLIYRIAMKGTTADCGPYPEKRIIRGDPK